MVEIRLYTVIRCYMTSTKKYNYKHFPIFMLAKGEELICDNVDNISYQQIGPKYSEKTNKYYHEKLVYDYNGKEGHFRVIYKTKDIISSFSLLADEGREPSKVKLGLLKVMGIDPTYDHFNGDATFERL